MTRATVVRLEHNDTETLGVLLLDGQLFCYTLELPWRSNQKNISCIPTGQYRCRRYDSPQFGPVFGVQDVPGRSDIILGHVGNEHYDTTGCILLGRYPGRLAKEGPRAVISSQQICAALMAWLDDQEEIELQIIEVRV